MDSKKKSFYLGYYLHLLTDAIWIELVSRPVIESFKTTQEYNRIARNQFRNDWYHTEIKFLQKNPEFYPLKILKKVRNFENIYLSYASDKVINERIKQFSYDYRLTDVNENTNYPYFTYENYEKVVVSINRLIRMNLLSR